MVKSLMPSSLADLPRGTIGRIASLSEDIPSYERQRLLDLGAVPGTLVDVRGAAALGGLRAYGLRGTVIGLRQSQAERILLEASV